MLWVGLYYCEPSTRAHAEAEWIGRGCSGKNGTDRPSVSTDTHNAAASQHRQVQWSKTYDVCACEEGRGEGREGGVVAGGKMRESERERESESESESERAGKVAGFWVDASTLPVPDMRKSVSSSSSSTNSTAAFPPWLSGAQSREGRGGTPRRRAEPTETQWGTARTPSKLHRRTKLQAAPLQIYTSRKKKKRSVRCAPEPSIPAWRLS